MAPEPSQEPAAAADGLAWWMAERRRGPLDATSARRRGLHAPREDAQVYAQLET